MNKKLSFPLAMKWSPYTWERWDKLSKEEREKVEYTYQENITNRGLAKLRNILGLINNRRKGKNALSE